LHGIQVPRDGVASIASFDAHKKANIDADRIRLVYRWE
jgi:hypothetical protein